MRPNPTPDMEVRSSLLGSMTDVEKSVKHLVTEANLRLVGLLAPHQDMRESTAGSATAEEEPEQQPPASPPRRRPTGVMLREPVGTPPAERPSAPLGKGKKKATEPVELSNDSSDDSSTIISLLDNLPIPCHLFDGDDNFKYAPHLGPNFFMSKSEYKTSRVYRITTSNNSSGI